MFTNLKFRLCCVAPYFKNMTLSDNVQSIYTWLRFFPLWLNLSPLPLPMLTHRLLADTTVYACNECREIFKHKQLCVNKVLHCHIYIHNFLFCSLQWSV